jgi:hypothetical protein
VLTGPLAEDADLDVEEELKLLMTDGEFEEEPPRAKHPSIVNRIPTAVPSEAPPEPSRVTLIADIVAPVHGF